MIGLAIVSATTEWLLMGLSIVTSLAVLVTGCVRAHRQWRALAPFVFGAVALLVVRVAEDAEGIVTDIAVVGGSASVVVAHVLNIRLCRRVGGTSCGGPSESRAVRLEHAGSS